jgi:hypothetical protein
MLIHIGQVSGQCCGVTGYVDDPIGFGSGDGMEDFFIAAGSGGIKDYDVGMDAVLDEFRKGIGGVTENEFSIIGYGCLWRFGWRL